MKLTDIKKAINTLLETNFPGHKIYADDIKEGFSRPCFFVELLPISRDNEGNGLYSRRVSVIINYFSRDKTSLENIKMQDQLEEIFGQTLTVGDRVVTINNIEGYINDGILQFSFNIDYVDSLDITQDYELMGELEMKEDY